MQYFMAFRIGEERASKAQLKLMEYVPTATVAMVVKDRGGDFEPVGEENLYTIVDTSENMSIIALCDSEGYVKAMSNPMPKTAVRAVAEKMRRDGIGEYTGKVTLPI